MEVSVKFSPQPLYLPEITSEPTKQEALLSPEQAWTFLENRKIFCFVTRLKSAWFNL